MTNKQKSMELKPIGVIHANEEKMEFSIEVKEEYRAGLKELEKYSHVHVIFWGNQTDTEEARKTLIAEDLPFFYGKDAPAMGVFANRSQFRPNPILMSPTKILDVDHEKGLVIVSYLDAFDQTPLLDLKPYIAMSDRILTAEYPPYLKHWPDCNEKAMEWWAQQMEQQEEE